MATDAFLFTLSAVMAQYSHGLRDGRTAFRTTVLFETRLNSSSLCVGYWEIFLHGRSGRSRKLATRHQLVPVLRNNWVLRLFSHTPSWRDRFRDNSYVSSFLWLYGWMANTQISRKHVRHARPSGNLYISLVVACSKQAVSLKGF
jgi:hypothetical protein